jgi:hypothetical protein
VPPPDSGYGWHAVPAVRGVQVPLAGGVWTRMSVPWRRATSKKAVTISAAHSGRSKGIWPYQLLLLEVATVVFRLSGKEREEIARHQPYESGSETPNAIKIAMRAKQPPVSRSVLILGMKSMK